MKQRPFMISVALVILAGVGIAALMRMLPAIEKESETTPSEPKTNTTRDVMGTKQAHEHLLDRRTPYQFLNLMIGNADALSFTYSLQLHETGQPEEGAFYCYHGNMAAVFTTQDEQGKRMTVREVESGGTVYYILDHTKTVKRYPGPAADFLLYEMMQIAQGEPSEVVEENGDRCYKYVLPLEEDQSVTQEYRLLMRNGGLEEMSYIVDGFLVKTYQFSKFEQEIKDETVFTIPADYQEIAHEDMVQDLEIPPWWSSDGLS